LRNYHTESIALVALSNITDIGPRKMRSIISYFKKPSLAFELNKGKLLQVNGLSDKIVDALLNGKEELENARLLIEANQKRGIQTITFYDEAYPQRLKDIKDAPLVLFYQGKASLNHPRIISIVGTRKVTEYGLDITRQLVSDLAKYNCLILSGLAYGIDIAAHKAAIEFGIPTIGVMANSLDTVYPSQHKHIANQMAMKNGGLLSENKLGTKPDPRLFPARNRIIAGLSDAVIVVEAMKKGGACITAEIANSYYKDVFAFPGDVRSLASEGCNNLIRNNKAQLITSAKDLEYHLNWDKEIGKLVKRQLDLSTFTKPEQLIIKVLQEQPLPIDILSWKTALQVNELASFLLGLEFQGVVKQLPGKTFQLV